MTEVSQLNVGSTTFDIKDTTTRNTKLDKAGGTITGNLTINGSTSGIKINHLGQTGLTTLVFNCGSSTISL